ncbi:hypothetical protein F5Y10DRAFT_290211 [Nemania abortiva]|nr:hypothetical protein F5Y10DRAFT_290211 [Nemania abortiva]
MVRFTENQDEQSIKEKQQKQQQRKELRLLCKQQQTLHQCQPSLAATYIPPSRSEIVTQPDVHVTSLNFLNDIEASFSPSIADWKCLGEYPTMTEYPGCAKNIIAEDSGAFENTSLSSRTSCSQPSTITIERDCKTTRQSSVQSDMVTHPIEPSLQAAKPAATHSTNHLAGAELDFSHESFRMRLPLPPSLDEDAHHQVAKVLAEELVATIPLGGLCSELRDSKESGRPTDRSNDHKLDANIHVAKPDLTQNNVDRPQSHVHNSKAASPEISSRSSYAAVSPPALKSQTTSLKEQPVTLSLATGVSSSLPSSAVEEQLASEEADELLLEDVSSLSNASASQLGKRSRSASTFVTPIPTTREGDTSSVQLQGHTHAVKSPDTLTSMSSSEISITTTIKRRRDTSPPSQHDPWPGRIRARAEKQIRDASSDSEGEPARYSKRQRCQRTAPDTERSLRRLPARIEATVSTKSASCNRGGNWVRGRPTKSRTKKATATGRNSNEPPSHTRKLGSNQEELANDRQILSNDAKTGQNRLPPPYSHENTAQIQAKLHTTFCAQEKPNQKVYISSTSNCTPTAIAIETPRFPCERCGFSAETMLQLSAFVEAQLDSGQAMAIIPFFLAFMRDCSQQSLAQLNSVAEHDSLPNIVAYDQTDGADMTLGPGFNRENGNSEASDEGDISDRGSLADSVESIPHGSIGVCENQDDVLKRGRLSNLEKARLRAWVKEDKSWTWIGAKLHRKPETMSNYWRIMSKGG